MKYLSLFSGIGGLMFSYTEMEKLFGYSEGYTLCLSNSKVKT